MNDSGIQHKQIFGAQPGFGFSDEGERVPIVMPDEPGFDSGLGDEDAHRVRQETIVRLLSHLLRAGTAEEIGRMVLMISYALRHPDGPRTLEQVGALFATEGRLGVGKARVSQILSALNLESGGFTELSD